MVPSSGADSTRAVLQLGVRQQSVSTICAVDIRNLHQKHMCVTSYSVQRTVTRLALPPALFCRNDA